MYHYVRLPDEGYPNFKYLHFEDFCSQLNYFEDNFGFVSKQDLVKSLETGKVTDGVILTFDDAFRDHYQFVFPELKRRGLWGIFYVPTLPFQQEKILDVHRIHLLLGKFDSRDILSELNNIVTEEMLSHIDNVEFKELTYGTQKSNVEDSFVTVKRILNYYISYHYRSRVIDQLITKFFGQDKNLMEEVYLSVPDLQEMEEAGMVIGSHTSSHPVLSKLNTKDQELEIKDSFSFLNSFLKFTDFKTFCYPHGGFHTFTDKTEEILENEQVHFSFNVEARDINSSDLLNRKQALPRYDCNLFPYGSIRV